MERLDGGEKLGGGEEIEDLVLERPGILKD